MIRRFTPGSVAAKRHGCTCTDEGVQRKDGKAGYWINVLCPLHGPQPKKEIVAENNYPAMIAPSVCHDGASCVNPGTECGSCLLSNRPVPIRSDRKFGTTVSA